VSRPQPAPARRPRKGDLVVWEQPTSWARGGVTYHVGTAAHVRRDGQLAALATAHGAPAWRAAWKPASRPPITRTWHLPAERVDVAGALAAVRAHARPLHDLDEVRALLAPFLRHPANDAADRQPADRARRERP
jgi:hypothetical protein